MVRLPKVFYHGTRKSSWESIQKEGLRPDRPLDGHKMWHRPGVFLAVDAGTAKMYPDYEMDPEGNLVLQIDTRQLNPYDLGPDLDDWYGRDHTKMAPEQQLRYSLKHIGQVVYNNVIPPTAISIHQMNEKIEQIRINTKELREEPQMSLRAMIAESENEYHYKVFSTANLHDPAKLAMIRFGLSGRMARDIEPAGVVPYSGSKSDRFPQVPMKPVFVVELITGLPLRLRRAEIELALALNVPQELIKVEGEDVDVTAPQNEARDKNKPYDKDGVTPGFLSKFEKNDDYVVSLKDLLGDLTSGNCDGTEKVKDVYEGFSMTQIEAEMLLGADLRRGYYAVRGLGGKGNVGISGPHAEAPFNYPLDLDRTRELQVESVAGSRRMGSLVEYTVNLVGGVLNEMNYSQSNLTTVRVQDETTGEEFPILVTVEPGMGDEEIRNAAIQQVAQKTAKSPDVFIALDPNRVQPGAAPAAQQAVA